MKAEEHYQGECEHFVLRSYLRDKQATMLAFLFNLDYSIAAEKFDQKFPVFS